MSKSKNQRANDLNPNNRGYKYAQDNRSNQLNPNNPNSTKNSNDIQHLTPWELDSDTLFADDFNGRD